MVKVLIVAMDRDSRTAAGIAATIVRRLSRKRFTCAFVTAPDGTALVHDLGYPALALDGESPSANRDHLDRLVSTFQPDYLLVADEPALARSTGWSGLDLALLRQRYPVPLVCLDRYGRGAEPVAVDGYGEPARELPGLSSQCDLVLRHAPPFRVDQAASGARPIALTGGGLQGTAVLAAPPASPPRNGVATVFISDPAGAAAPPGPVQRLAAAMPRILHDHLAALDRPLHVLHVGGAAWEFAVSDRLEYRHVARLPQALHRDQLLSSDLYLTANVASLSLAEAAVSGVPALLLHQDHELVVRGPAASGPGWLADAAPELARIHPFLAFPWGWHRLLSEALRDNPYTNCFHSAGLADRPAVLAAATMLLDDTSARSALYQRQLDHRAELDALPTLADVLAGVVAR